MTPQERKVMKLALEALELMYGCYANPSWVSYKVHEAQILEQTLDTITTIKEALAEAECDRQPERLAELGWQEIDCPICGGCAMAFPKPKQEQLMRDQINYGMSVTQDGKRIDPMSTYKEPEQEPVPALYVKDINGNFHPYKEKGHTENCAAFGDDCSENHLPPSLVGVGEADYMAQPEQDYPTDEHGYPIYSNGTHADISKAHAKFESRFEPESIWIGTGHLREILNGNTLNAYCSPEQDRFTDVQLYTTPPQRKPLKDDELKVEFGKLYPNDIGILELAENNKDFAVEAIGARHHWVAFKAGARAIEAAHGIKE